MFNSLGTAPARDLSRYATRVRALCARLRAAPAKLPQLRRAIAAAPIETLLYIPEQLSQWRHRPVPYQVEEEWGRSFHEALGMEWPCSEAHTFKEVWEQVHAELAAKGLAVGRWTYGSYSDADAAMAGAVWCAVRHRAPRAVLETGVARGVTSRVVLEAMARNGVGRLWSIDLPNLFGTHDLASQTAAAVPDAFRDRWTYVEGSSRRRLEPLLSQLGTIDMFIHDSLHTVRNMRFEMEAVWPTLCDGGLMVIDDVDKAAFRDFTAGISNDRSMVYRSADGPWMFGVVVRADSD